MANVIAPGLPAPSTYTTNQGVPGKARIGLKVLKIFSPPSLL